MQYRLGFNDDPVYNKLIKGDLLHLESIVIEFHQPIQSQDDIAKLGEAALDAMGELVPGLRESIASFCVVSWKRMEE